MSELPPCVEVTEKTFPEVVLQNSQLIPVLTQFMGVWSGPCVMQQDRFTALAKEFDGRFLFTFVDVDEQPELRQRYKIENVPTLILFQNGEPSRVEMGELNEADARALLKDIGIFRESDALREQAQAKHMAGDSPGAILLLTQAIQSDPGNVRVALDMVQILIDTGRVDDANGLFQRLPEAHRESDMGKALQGQLLFAGLAAKTEGIGALEARLAGDADDHAARFDWAICQVAGHQLDAAMDALFKIQEAAPDFRDGAAREMIVTLVNMLTPTAPEAAAGYRQRLSNLLSS